MVSVGRTRGELVLKVAPVTQAGGVRQSLALHPGRTAMPPHNYRPSLALRNRVVARTGGVDARGLNRRTVKTPQGEVNHG